MRSNEDKRGRRKDDAIENYNYGKAKTMHAMRTLFREVEQNIKTLPEDIQIVA